MQNIWRKRAVLAGCVALPLLFAGCGETQKTKEAMQLVGDMDYQGALAMLEEAQTLDEDPRLIARGRGIACMGLTDYEQAIGWFEQALAESDGIIQNVDYDINYYLAASYAKTGDYASARSAYDAILALKPREKDAYFLRGKVKLALQDVPGAQEDFDRVIAMEPSNYDRLIDIFEALDAHGHKEIGVAYLQTALKEGEKQMKAYDSGRIYYHLGEYQKAYIALEEAKSKGGADSYMYLGMAYEATGDYNYAASVYSSYIGKEGGNAGMYNRLGLCEIAREDYRKALEAFQAGLALEGGDAYRQALTFNEAMTYEYLGEYQEASKKLNQYLKNYPEDDLAKREHDFLSTR